MKVFVINTTQGQIFFEGPVSDPRIIPSVFFQSRSDGVFVSGGSLDLSRQEGIQPANPNATYLPDGAGEITSPHWSMIAMIGLVQDQQKKLLVSSDPVALARLAASSGPGFREFDGRNADWRRDLLILSQCVHWERYKASQAEMYDHAVTQGVIADQNAITGAKWLATRISRLKKKYS